MSGPNNNIIKVKGPDGQVYGFPAGTPEAEMASALETVYGQAAATDEGPEAGSSALRVAEFGARGFMDRAADVVGAVPELAASGLRAIDPRLAPPRGYYPEAIKGGLRTVGRAISAPVNDLVDFGPAAPQSGAERAAYSAGTGVADAASFMLPGAAVARYSQAGGLPARVGQAMTVAPKTQLAAAGLGGGVSEATDSETLGLAASLALPVGSALARRAITPFPSQLGPNEQRLAAAAERAGIRLTPGQKTGSAPLRTMESVFTQTPFTGKAQGEIYDAQRKAFNRAVLEKAGVYADDARPEVIAKAFKDIGDEFDNLASQTDVKIDAAFVNGFKRIEDDFAKYFGADAASRFQQVKNKIGAMVKAYQNPQTLSVNIPGKEYKEAMSKIKALTRNATDPFEKDGLIELQRLIDDAVERSAGPKVRAAWRDVRNRYRNLLTIDKAMQGGTQAARASADVPFGPLKTAVLQSDKSGYARGRGDLNEISRVGDFLGAAIPPDSGTARRSLVQSLLTGGAGGAGGGYMLAGGDPITAALMAGGALAGPKLAQTAYMTPAVQRYFSNQLMPGGRLSKALLGDIVAAQQLGYGLE